jgi:hypothetical protein
LSKLEGSVNIFVQIFSGIKASKVQDLKSRVVDKEEEHLETIKNSKLKMKKGKSKAADY